MSDKELLEKAARGAGIECTSVVAEGVPHRFGGGYWNPLTDDGDALRLAVKLGLDVCIDTPQEKEPHTHVIGFAGASADTLDSIELHGDPYAATRRAIVRAAAQIGETK